MIDCFKFTVAVNQGGLFSKDKAYSLSGFSFAVSSDYQIPCRILYNYIGVMWDGKMSSCCVDYSEEFVVGEISSGLANVFHNARSRQLRKDHLHGEFGSLCGQCGFNNAVVDWFEDEVNEYVQEHLMDVMDEKNDHFFFAFLHETIEKFEYIGSHPPKRRAYFG